MGPLVEHNLVANNYPLYLDVLDKKEDIEEEIEALQRAIEQPRDSLRKEDYEDSVMAQNTIIKRITQLFGDANTALGLQTAASEQSRPTSDALRSSINMLEQKLGVLLSKKGGVGARAETAEELTSSASRKDSEYVQMVAYLTLVIVVLLLCAQSAVSNEQNAYETVLLVLILVIAAYYLVVEYIL